ncbi:MAG: hypothetical protein ACAH95_12550, partial [Fimbriimonas sp.]
RSNVGRFTRTVLKNGPSLQAEIQFASGLNDEQVTGWYSSRLPQLKYLQMLIGASAINESEQMGVARFLSTLQPFQLQQLLNGRTMTLENMSPEQSRQLTRHFYDGEAGWSRIETEPEPEVEPETGESFAARLSLDRFGEVSEPTELLPSGIPRSTTLSIKSKRENKFLSSSMPMSAKSIAAAMLCQKKGFLEEEFMGDITKEFLVSKVKPVTRFEHIVTFSFSPKTHSDSAFIYQIPRFAKREVTLDDPLMKGEIDYWIKKLDGLSKEELIRSMFSGDEDGG